MTDQTRLGEIEARLNATTPGKWERINEGVGIVGPGYVCQFVARNVAKADAVFIAHSPADLRYLLDEVARVTAERDAERSLREEYQLKLAFRDADAARLRAVIEEARARVSRIDVQEGDTIDALDIELAEIVDLLDRGLKGDGE